MPAAHLPMCRPKHLAEYQRQLQAGCRPLLDGAEAQLDRCVWRALFISAVCCTCCVRVCVLKLYTEAVGPRRCGATSQ